MTGTRLVLASLRPGSVSNEFDLCRFCFRLGIPSCSYSRHQRLPWHEAESIRLVVLEAGNRYPCLLPTSLPFLPLSAAEQLVSASRATFASHTLVSPDATDPGLTMQFFATPARLVSIAIVCCALRQSSIFITISSPHLSITNTQSSLRAL